MEPVVIAALVTGTISGLLTVVQSFNTHFERKDDNRSKVSLLTKQHRFDEKINKLNHEFSNDIEKIRIDANIIAKSRIEWIQAVRNEFKDLVESYYSILLCLAENDIQTDKYKLMDKLVKVKQRSACVILYFGNDIEVEPIDLMCNDSNKGKNDQIVELILDIQKKTEEYCMKSLKQLKTQVSKEYNNAKEDLANNTFPGDSYSIYDGEVMQNNIYVPNDEHEVIMHYEQRLSIIQRQIDAIESAEAQEIYAMINKLNDAIRLYLKIDWNVAKTGK